MLGVVRCNVDVPRRSRRDAEQRSRRSARPVAQRPRSSDLRKAAITCECTVGVCAAQARRPDARVPRPARSHAHRAGSAFRGRAPSTNAAPGSARRTPLRSWGRSVHSAASRTSPASTRACSASETVGFEMPARREISARRSAPARMVSSTLRSLRCLRSGGVARASLSRFSPSWSRKVNSRKHGIRQSLTLLRLRRESSFGTFTRLQMVGATRRRLWIEKTGVDRQLTPREAGYETRGWACSWRSCSARRSSRQPRGVRLRPARPAQRPTTSRSGWAGARPS